MANYYTQMCAEIVPKTDVARTWLRDQFKALQAFQNILDDGEVDLTSETAYDDAHAFLLKHVEGTMDPTLDPGMLQLVKTWDPLEGQGMPGFDLEEESASVFFEDDGEQVEVKRVADFLQLYLRKFEPAGRFGFEYAFTGDRHRPDTFGGGACFVTATHVRWMVSNDWLAKQKRAFDTRHERARPKRARPKKVVKTKKKR
jgi:hypothetical protein